MGSLMLASSARSSEPDSEQGLCDLQQASQVVKRLEVLPTMQRSALILRYGHDLSVSEIAKLMDIKPSTVKTHLVRGIRRLRVQVRPEGAIE